MTTEFAPATLVELQPMSGEAKPVTTSIKVAEYFGKEHYNVVRDIKAVIAKCSESFNALNFEGVDYVDQKGEKRPMYLLTRDGFTMVAMGYTGEKAMQFKEAYINAFNEMARKLATNTNIVDTLGGVRCILEAADITGNQLALAMDKVYRLKMGFSALEASGTVLVSPEQELLLTPTEIGAQLDPVLSGKAVNLLLAGAGYQKRLGKQWQPTEKAAGMYKLLDVNKSRSRGTPVTQLKWLASILDIVRSLLGEKAA